MITPTVRQVYQRICTRWLEPAGLQSGIFTDADFLRHFAGVVEDFMERTSIVKILLTQAIHFSIPDYVVPDQMSHVENVFVTGRLLRRTDLDALNQTVYQWRKAVGIPREFHEDGLPAKTIELFPNPNYEGAPIPLPPDPNVFQIPENDNYINVIVGDFYPTWRDLTLVGPQAPLNPDWSPRVTWTLDDTISDVPASAMPYLAWGVLAKMFGDDSEAKDEQRASYCLGRYEEGIALFQAIMAEHVEDDVDAAM